MSGIDGVSQVGSAGVGDKGQAGVDGSCLQQHVDNETTAPVNITKVGQEFKKFYSLKKIL